jgi:hypothetical protein
MCLSLRRISTELLIVVSELNICIEDEGVTSKSVVFVSVSMLRQQCYPAHSSAEHAGESLPA